MFLLQNLELKENKMAEAAVVKNTKPSEYCVAIFAMAAMLFVIIYII